MDFSFQYYLDCQWDAQKSTCNIKLLIPPKCEVPTTQIEDHDQLLKYKLIYTNISQCICMHAIAIYAMLLSIMSSNHFTTMR